LSLHQAPMSFEEAKARLTGPGGPFEVAKEEVRGIPMLVYKDRMKSLREVGNLARGHGAEREAVIYGDRRISYPEFMRRADDLSCYLVCEVGLQRGDRVAVLSANNPEWCIAFWAVVDAGLVLVGLNGWWKTPEILYGLQDSGARVLIVDEERWERVKGSLDNLADLEQVLLITEDSFELVHERVPSNSKEVREVHDAGCPALEIPIDEDDPAVIFYTSGTTGKPKGAVSTHRSMIANLQNTFFTVMVSAMTDPGGGMMALGDGPPANLLTAPLFHVAGCHSNLVTGIAAGVKLVMPVGRFDPLKVMELIEKERIQTWASVATMVWRVLESPDKDRFDLSSVRTVAYGGSPAAPELVRRIPQVFPSVTQMGNAYGLTETSSVATMNRGADYVRKPESVGRPMPVVEIRVVDEDGKDLPVGLVGEVLVKGPILMAGYWHNPEATAQIIEEGWLHTGDLGYLDEEGFLYITDRAKDMIIRGGENVYCVEIENRLLEHPAIADAAVVGVPHPVLGEEVKAIVCLEPGTSLEPDEVRSWVAQELADFKVPAHVEFRSDPLPRNPSGKLLKNLLRGSGDSAFEETW
jgi:long-chain acyl-CoA synthetase